MGSHDWFLELQPASFHSCSIPSQQWVVWPCSSSRGWEMAVLHVEKSSPNQPPPCKIPVELKNIHFCWKESCLLYSVVCFWGNKTRAGYMQDKHPLHTQHWQAGFFFFFFTTSATWGALVAQIVKNLPAIQETRFWSWFGKIPWRREWLPAAVFLPGEFHGQKPGRIQSLGLQRVRHD